MIEIETMISQLDIKSVTGPELKLMKEKGLSDQYLANEWRVPEAKIRMLRKEHGIKPAFKMVDTCAAEFESSSNYFYSTYSGESETPAQSGKHKVLILGSGPISIGQGIEFDYCSVHGVFALKEENVETIMINNNPETVSTDFAISDRLYFEPLTIEDILNVVEAEGIKEAIVQLGGQTALNLAKGLEEAGVTLLGTNSQTIDVLEDRDLFYKLLDRLEIPRVKGETAENKAELLEAAARLGYPVLVRPSYVIGGLNMTVINSERQLEDYIEQGTMQYPILVDQYLEAKEAELDLAADGKHIVIPAIIEHIEKTGVHSGDSFCFIPSQNFSANLQQLMAEYATKIVTALNYKGLMNIQFIVKDEQVYMLEVNPRSSRTMPIVSKVSGEDLVKKATRILLGKYYLSKDEILLDGNLPFICVKHPVFSNFALKGLDAKTGPQMISTGEGISIAKTAEEALFKSFHSLLGKERKKTVAFAQKNDFAAVSMDMGAADISLVELGEVEDSREISVLYSPGDSERDVQMREWAIKNRKLVFTEEETLNAFLKSSSKGRWDVKSLGEWHELINEEVMAK